MRPVPVAKPTWAEDRDELAKIVYAAMIGADRLQSEADGVSDFARDSFRVADAWMLERDRKRSIPPPTGDDRSVPVENARAYGIDGSGAIELGERQSSPDVAPFRVGPFTDQVWAIYSSVDGRPCMSGPGMPLTFRRRELAEAAIREMSPSAWIAVAVELTVAPLP